MNGGVETLNSYHVSEQWPVPSTHHTFLAELKNYYETEKHIFVHAGLRPGIPLAGQSDKDLLWIRQDFLRSNYDWGKVVVYGHTPLNNPLLTETRIGLDSGCVYGRKLTCCDVLTDQLWQA
jgi:serine/threonine protein phosphatase 1